MSCLPALVDHPCWATSGSARQLVRLLLLQQHLSFFFTCLKVMGCQHLVPWLQLGALLLQTPAFPAIRSDSIPCCCRCMGVPKVPSCQHSHSCLLHAVGCRGGADT